MGGIFFSCAADGSHSGTATRSAAASGPTGLEACPLQEQQLPSFVDIFRRCRAAVVNVSAGRSYQQEDERFSKNDQRRLHAWVRSLGSGFVLDRSGHVVTCASVVEDADDIEVLLSSGRRLPARLVGRDPETDLAVLSIDADAAPAPLELGDSAGLRSGQWVAAFGYPYGLSHSISAGIISAVRRPDKTHPAYGLIVSDAAVNPGCNGGPLVDTQGRVVGINLVAQQSEGGAGLAIPINDARNRLPAISQGKTPPSPWLGLGIKSVNREQAEQASLDTPRGAWISRVVPQGPADRAGLQSGDIVLRLGERSIADADDMAEAVRSLEIDRPVRLEITHGQKRLQVEITPVQRP